MAVKKKASTELVEITPIQIQQTLIRLEGSTPLITHAWSAKAKRMMLDAQQGKKKGAARDFKDPVADFIDSMYWLTPKPEEKTEAGFDAAVAAGARWGFPVKAFKSAAVSAAYRNGWTKDKVSARGTFFLFAEDGDAELAEIHTEEPPVMREDMVRVGMGTADIRYRGEFQHWYVNLIVSWNTNGQYSLQNIINMINAGGYSCGVGEWRPEKDGTNGMYHVAAD